MYILYIAMLLFTFILFMLIKNKITILKLMSLIIFSSGVFLTVIGFIVKIVIRTNIKFFNTTTITSIVFNKFFYNSLIFVVIGIILYILYIVIEYKKSVKINVKSN